MNTGTVTTVLQGGLGNTMFQIAAAIGYGLEHNKNVAFYREAYRASSHGPIENYFNNILKHINFESLPPEPLFKHYPEPTFHYSEIPYIDGNLLLEGYFQSEKYFLSHKNIIQNLFSYDYDIPKHKKEVLKHEETCSIHIRRGDYLHLPQYHPVQDLEYYRQAISNFGNNTTFIIISNDMLWCKQNFIGENFIFTTNNKPEEDFYIASRCHHNIIANSTFSWWSAWLNLNPDKKVIAPKKWFGPEYYDKNTKDIYCPDWVLI